MKPTTTKVPPTPLERRQFLLGATLGTAGAIAGAAALVTSASAPESAAADQTPLDSAATGYRETPHIKRYYDTTRL
jgi:nitrous oxide reductase